MTAMEGAPPKRAIPEAWSCNSLLRVTDDGQFDCMALLSLGFSACRSKG